MKNESKIPANAKMVFEGVIFDVWQWEQEMFDGSKQTFEMIKRTNTVRIIAISKGKIVILDQEQPGKPPYKSLPAGRIEKDEEPIHAAKRELLEETGLESNDWVSWRSDNISAKIDWTIFTYIARDCIKTHGQNLDHGEKITAELFSFDEFINLVDNPLFIEKDLFPIMLRAQYDQKASEELKLLLGVNRF